ncbi:SGNH/GDSL hydrolase family protein [Brevibacterium casei]|uniref:GDSL-like Lipase/Acylhydrolase n=1 Tax=Brevibacterium casei TaxID=33889 RepID=A0A449D862_9MICO|nr:SGNH/GDSL hydrolase family protein [Brevibacterium casei]MCT1767293.1 SGNH/GDSL hydrolase family protein [Brevibacterium casei]VEW13799.1 GDSL-like Lipase/Acylhydrolase [Brevibacterium casei]
MLETITSYVAIGDSFSEGLMDPDPDGTPDRFRGWTDRLAELLVDSPAGGPELLYANFAIRGRLLQGVIDEQVPKVLDLKPDLVSFCAGGNDCLRPRTDIDGLANQFERAVIAMRDEGIEVVMANGFDTETMSPLLRAVRPRVGVYNAHLWTIAQRHGCHMVDVWGLRPLYAEDMWAEDKIHLSPDGHDLVARQALATLESGHSLPTTGFGMPPRTTRAIRDVVVEESKWAREHLAPWVGRRLRGQSSGDLLSPKVPDLSPVRKIAVDDEVDVTAAAHEPGFSGGDPSDGEGSGSAVAAGERTGVDVETAQLISDDGRVAVDGRRIVKEDEDE